MSAPRRKPVVDPRIERSRQVILQAVLEELSELGYGALTIESAARRAGVGKATIYRHWPDKIALIADAFKLLQQQRDPELVTGSPREKLERILRHVADVVADSPFSSCLPALIELISNGIATRDFPPRTDPETAAFALLGAIFFCRLMTNTPFPVERVRDLIDTVFGSNG